MSFSAELELAKSIGYKAGEMMSEKFQGEFSHKKKDDGTSVTEVDEAINSMVIASVIEKFPEHAVLGEEESHGDTSGAEFTWVCDPIDGTHAFMIGMPTNIFSLALTRNGDPVVAVAYDPYTDRMFTATNEQKTQVNGIEISVSDRPSFEYAIANFSTSRMLSINRFKLLDNLKIDWNTRAIDPWSVVYAGVLLAGGHIDFMVFSIKNAHDVAALKLLIEQAGGKTSDLEGNDQKYDRDTNGFVASNGQFHDEIIELLKPHLKK